MAKNRLLSCFFLFYSDHKILLSFIPGTRTLKEHIMRAVVQRVSKASVSIGSKTTGRISRGLVVLIGVGKNDTRGDVSYLAEKIVNLRVFPDERDLMNLSVRDVNGGILVVSQFTLFGDCRKGRRPSYNDAAPPEKAEELYNQFVCALKDRNIRVETGVFQAIMEVDITNSGPVTILLDSTKLF